MVIFILHIDVLLRIKCKLLVKGYLLVEILPFLYKGDNFCEFLFTLMRTVLCEKGSTLKGKNFLPQGSKFFPFKVNLFSQGRQNSFEKLTCPESVAVSLNFDPCRTLVTNETRVVDGLNA